MTVMGRSAGATIHFPVRSGAPGVTLVAAL